VLPQASQTPGRTPDEAETAAALRRTVAALPALDGQAAVVAVATGHGRLWELCAAGAGPVPASAASLAALVEAWSAALVAEGFTPAMAPRGLPGAESLPLASSAEVLCEVPLRLQYRSLGPDFGDQPLEALHAIEAVCELSEHAVLELGQCLRVVLTTSRSQWEEISDAVKLAEAPDADGARRLASALQTLERSSRAVHENCTNALQALQYQDRAAQLLRHAADQVRFLERLLGAVEAGSRDVQTRAGAMGRALPSEAETLQPSDVQLF